MYNLKTGLEEKVPRALDEDITKNVLPTTCLIINDFLTSDECDYFTEYVDRTHKLSPGVNREGNQTSNRYSNVSFIAPDTENGWLYNKILDKILPINKQYMKFDLTHLDRLQYASYGENQYLGYHTDDHFDYIQVNNETRDLSLRKLSVSIGLNEEYEGGEFEIQNFKGTPNEPYDVKKFRLKKGSAIVFSSFLLHRVYPVTTGVRKAVVAWFFGPKWK